MRLYYKPEINRTELEKLKFKINDVALFGGERYIVTGVGMKYLYAYNENDETKKNCLLVIKQVAKADAS